MSWTIRAAGPGDSEALALLGGASFLETFAGHMHGSSIVSHCAAEHSPDAYRCFFANGASAWLAEVDEGKAPVGYALLSEPAFLNDDDSPTTVELKRIYVLSRYHGLGMAQQLLASVIAEARNRSAEQITLVVFSGNERAIRFYEKNGFSVTGAKRSLIGDREYDDLLMLRPL